MNILLLVFFFFNGLILIGLCCQVKKDIRLSEHNHREFMRAIKTSNRLIVEENQTLKRQNEDMKSCCNCQDVTICWKFENDSGGKNGT